jgi:hypothetical protein
VCCCYDRAQQLCVDALERDFTACTQFLADDLQRHCMRGPDTAGRSTSFLAVTTADGVAAAEELAYTTAVYLHAMFPIIVVGPSGPVVPALVPQATLDRILQSVLCLAVVGSPRLQVICLRMLRTLLPLFPVETVDAIVAAEAARCEAMFRWPLAVVGRTGGTTTPRVPLSLLQLLLFRIAQTLCVTPQGVTHSLGTIGQPVGVGAGAVAISIAAEACNLYRVLLRRPAGWMPLPHVLPFCGSWSSVAADTLTSTLCAVAPYVAGDGLSGSAASSDLCRCVCMRHLCVCCASPVHACVYDHMCCTGAASPWRQRRSRFSAASRRSCVSAAASRSLRQIRRVVQQRRRRRWQVEPPLTPPPPSRPAASPHHCEAVPAAPLRPLLRVALVQAARQRRRQCRCAARRRWRR